MRGQQPTSPDDLIDQTVGTTHTAVLSDVEPDLLEIEFREGRQAQAIHRDARRFDALSSANRLRPRAFTRDASLRVDRGEYSANSPRSI